MNRARDPATVASMGRVDGKVALVTGGASGIGKAVAKLLAREGARVLVTDRIVQAGEAVAAEIGDAAAFVALDVTREDQWVAAVAAAVQRFGRLDILVNNAGVGVQKDIETTTLDEWRFVHAVNTEGVFLGCRESIKVMKLTGGGSIINVSSVAGLVGDGSLPAYCSSKGGVRLLSKSVALYCAQKGYGIRCNSVHPSFIATPMVEQMIDESTDPQKARARLTHASPLGKLGDVDDVAYMILYLASDESKFVTGTELVVDGGATAR
jgi:3(or 17)beta-hydroxysteroid dehydrogenase